MMLNLAIPLALHELASTLWIGGMFFAHFALRPSLNAELDPPARIRLLVAVFSRFFPLVWVAVATLWATGLWLWFGAYGGTAGLHVHLMTAIALVMTLIFAFIFALPYPSARRGAGEENWTQAARCLGVIRNLIAVNLALGLCNLVLGAAGPFLVARLQPLLG